MIGPSFFKRPNYQFEELFFVLEISVKHYSHCSTYQSGFHSLSNKGDSLGFLWENLSEYLIDSAALVLEYIGLLFLVSVILLFLGSLSLRTSGLGLPLCYFSAHTYKLIVKCN